MIFRTTRNRIFQGAVLLASLALASCATDLQKAEPPANNALDLRVLLALRVVPVAIAVRHRTMKSTAKGRSDLFVSDTYGGAVYGYRLKTGELIEQLVGFTQPQGIATDGKGNLYVAATGNEAVYVFPPGATTPSLVLNDAGWFPTDVAVSIKGEVAVTNIYSTNYGAGDVAFYKPGQTSAFNTVPTSLIMSVPRLCAYDAKGNLFVSGIGESTGTVAEIVRGGKGTQFKDLGIRGIQIPGGVEIARNGDIFVLDQQANTIDHYWRGHHKLAGVTVLRTGGSLVTFAMTPPNENYIWVSDSAPGNSSPGAAEKYLFPYGGWPIRSITTSSPVGIALSPWARP